jgi:predicted lipoprotein with Yx(FWY)xxD motif
MRNRLWAAPLALGAGALIAACGSAGAPSASHSTTTAPPAASATPKSGSQGAAVTIMTHTTSKGTVLTNGQGRTIYWFAIDTPTASKCTGTCLQYWPPVVGTPTAAAGTSLPKGFGTIMGTNGELQATYDGHPLYTYMGDTTAGQISGNGLNLSGGLWWAMTPNGAKLGAAASTGGTTSAPAGGGYGY